MVHFSAKLTKEAASINPYPNLWLTFRFTPVVIQPVSFSNGSERDVNTTRYCISLHVKLGFASNANAQIPAARGAEADVPVCSTVQMWSGRKRASISTVATLLS